jgi:hypothetical protein
LLGGAALEAGVQPLLGEETGLEIACRVTGGFRYSFIINLTQAVQPLPRRFAGGEDLLTGGKLTEGTALAPFDAFLVCEAEKI